MYELGVDLTWCWWSWMVDRNWDRDI